MSGFLRLIALGVTVLVLALAAGCNTMEGIGEDVSAAGEGLSGAASDSNPSKQ